MSYIEIDAETAHERAQASAVGEYPLQNKADESIHKTWEAYNHVQHPLQSWRVHSKHVFGSELKWRYEKHTI